MIRSQDSFDNNLKTYFPCLDREELECITGLLVLKENDTKEYETAKDNVLAMLRSILLKYSRSRHGARKKLRAKLINLAGLSTVIPIKEMQRSVCGISIPGPEQGVTPDIQAVGEGLIYKGEQEISPSQLGEIKAVRVLLDIPNNSGGTYYGDVDKNVKSILFSPDLRDIIKNESISSTSEPLTRSILINPHLKGVDTERDLLSIAFDIIMQTYYINIFHEKPKLYVPFQGERAARIMAEHFLEAMKELLSRNLEQFEGLTFFSGDKGMNLKPVAAFYSKGSAEYLYCVNSLIEHNRGEIGKLNFALGYGVDDLGMHL